MKRVIEISKEKPKPFKHVMVSFLKIEKVNYLGEPMCFKWITRGYIDKYGRWFRVIRDSYGETVEAIEIKSKPWRWSYCKG